MTYAISVITICYNNLVELQQTCQSVDEQTNPPQEHIIIDGSSNDEIVSWLTESAQPAFRFWVHERDKGIADAFNKGIQRASSSIIHLLNSGDQYFEKNALAVVKGAFEHDNKIMWTHSMYVQNRGGADVISGGQFDKNKLWKGMRTVAHPTMFIKKELYDTYGLYNLEFKIAMDYDFLVRIRNEKFAFIAKPLVYFAPGGASNVHLKKGLSEVKASYSAHIGRSSKLVLWQLRQQVLQLIMQTWVGRQWFKIKNRKQII